jgi:hypothetical protein
MTLHYVRMSVWSWALRYKQDADARYWWVDAFKRRVCLIAHKRGRFNA